MTGTDFQILPLSSIVESDRNPRTHFDQAKLAELAESIKAVGVHTPILVRALPGRRVPDTSADVTHEIIAGARRYRASRMAGQLAIPAIIHEMSDNEALEAAIVENLQRDGLTELDEAEGYEALMQHSAMTADEVGKKIGKSRSYVYARLKLLDLCPEAREALRTGDLDHSKGLLIARVPTHKLQLRAVEELTRKDHRGDTVSVRAASEWMRNNLMLRLDNAVFDIKDAKLVEGAGACGKCPKRTGANPELFNDVGSADVCTDTTCFNDKIQAHTDRVVANAKKKGLEVIEGKEALEVMPYAGSGYLRGYTDIDDKVSVAKGATTSLREQATPEELKQIKVLVDPHTHKPIEVVPDQLSYKLRERALATQQKTKEGKADSAAQAKKDREYALKTRRQELAERYHDAWRSQAVAAIEPRVLSGEVNQFTPAMLRAVMFYMVGGFDEVPDPGELAEILGAGEVEWYEHKEAMAAIAGGDDLTVGSSLIRWLLKCESKANWEWKNGEREYLEAAPMIEALSTLLEIDLQAIKRTEQDALRADFEALEEPPTATPSAAQTEEVQGGKAKPGKSKTPAAKKPKTSPEEAMQGIAAAMRGVEGAADDGRTDQGGKVVQDRDGADIEVGHRVQVVGDQLTDKWGKVASIEGGNIAVQLDGLSSDYIFSADELKSHGNTGLNPAAAWPFPKGYNTAVAA